MQVLKREYDFPPFLEKTRDLFEVGIRIDALYFLAFSSNKRNAKALLPRGNILFNFVSCFFEHITFLEVALQKYINFKLSMIFPFNLLSCIP